MDTTIDPKIKALVSAIGQSETGTSSPEAYKLRGKSGEFGRYQYMPDTWARYSKEAGVFSPLEQSTIEDQNKVAYYQVKKWKDEGYNPAQIASMWNAGPGKPDAYKEGWKGVNSKGVSYDTPEYTRKVSEAYRKLSGAEQLPASNQPIPGMNEPKTFLGDISNDLTEAGSKLADVTGRATSGQIHPVSGLIQGVGAVASGLGNVTTTALKHVPVLGHSIEGVEMMIGEGVNKALGTQTGQEVLGNYQKFAQEHPEAADNIGAGVEIASAFPVFKGLGMAKTAAKSGIKKALYGTADTLAESVAPVLGPVGKTKAFMRGDIGVEKRGLLRSSAITPGGKAVESANVIRSVAPKVEKLVGEEKFLEAAQTLKSTAGKIRDSYRKAAHVKGEGIVFPVKQYISTLKNIEVPDELVSDSYLNNLKDLLIKRTENIARSKGGKAENLVDILSDFDSMVKRQYPSLYKSDRMSPLRSIVREFRETTKQFAEDSIPDLNLKEQMRQVHLLLDSAENVARRGFTGKTNEIGKDILTDKFKKTRGLIKAGARGAIEGAGVGGVLKLLD